VSIGFGSVKSGFVVAQPVPKGEFSLFKYLGGHPPERALPAAGFAGKNLPLCRTPSTSC